ncbi:helix-turn-helix transcriptional regulator [Lactobacillus sp. DCY120]|uniref:Helix-turn-helix transcriptional regulator n=1 Tax=Bombilactobacillus apium TaxID=2675299 RepID=A0A850RCQ9_9LACO|nr:helix-turn-helix domain-containing protein [Bombilactobacillus apium]NVY97076.1 helix-turn-helix transcriptional regulator [Bombilactobacillus apium]
MTNLVVQDLNQWIKQAQMPAGKKLVLQAAVQLFAQDGYSATSTVAIAQAANLSQATIFKYFPTKNKLLDYILEIIVNNLVPQYSQKVLQSIRLRKLTFLN